MLDLFVRVVCKRESVKTQGNWRLKKFSWVAREKASREVKHVYSTWLECEESGQHGDCWFHKCLAGKAFPWDIHKTFYFANLSYLIHTIFTHTIYTPITHICWGVLLRENPSHNPWELEIIIPTFLYTIHCGFFSTPTSSFLYPWEVDSLNTYHTLLECQVRFWFYWEVLEKAKL